MSDSRKRKNSVLSTQFPPSASECFLAQFRRVLEKSKSTIQTKKNGISFRELVGINNFMVVGDLGAFEMEIEKLQEINYSFRFIPDQNDFDIVDWNLKFDRVSEIKMTLMQLAKKRNKIEFIGALDALIKKRADIHNLQSKKTSLQDLFGSSFDDNKKSELFNDNVEIKNSFRGFGRSF